MSARLFHDEKYQRLSRPAPCGQFLWHYLLFGPRTIAVPGLLPIGLGTVSDDLKWPLAATRRVWGEIERESMAEADWNVPLIWLPRAVYHNPPAAPNSAHSWGRALREHVSECALREKAEMFIADHLVTNEKLGQAFHEGFLKGLGQGKAQGIGQDMTYGMREGIAQDMSHAIHEGMQQGIPLPMRSPMPYSGVQDVHPDLGSTDQIPDQERTQTVRPRVPEDGGQGELALRPTPLKAPKGPPGNAVHAFVDDFVKSWQVVRRQSYGKPPERHYRAAKDLLRDIPDAARRATITSAFIRTKADRFPYNGSRTLPELAQHWRQVARELIEAGTLEPDPAVTGASDDAA